jgi:predicted transcriptional regulator
MNEYILKAPAKEKETNATKVMPHVTEKHEKGRLALLELLSGESRDIREIAKHFGLSTKTAKMRLYRAGDLIQGKGPDKTKKYTLTKKGIEVLAALREKYPKKKANTKVKAEPKKEEEPVKDEVKPEEEPTSTPFLQVPALPFPTEDEDDDPNALIRRGMFMEAQILKRLESPRMAATVVAEAARAFEMPAENVEIRLKALENSSALESYGNGRLVTTAAGAEKLRKLIDELSRPVGQEEE